MTASLSDVRDYHRNSMFCDARHSRPVYADTKGNSRLNLLLVGKLGVAPLKNEMELFKLKENTVAIGFHVT